MSEDTREYDAAIWPAPWRDVAIVPDVFCKTIQGGPLKGMTDINPIWRYSTATEKWGLCGVGWKVVIKKLWIERAEGVKEVAAFALIDLYVREGDAWSEPIPGVGGSKLVVKDKWGLHVNDECFKMAVTDAKSDAFKQLGFGAPIYAGMSDTKYANSGARAQARDDIGDRFDRGAPPPSQAQVTGGPVPICPDCQGEMYDNRKDRAADRAAGKGKRSRPAFKCKAYKDGCEGVVWSYTEWLRDSGQDMGTPPESPI